MVSLVVPTSSRQVVFSAVGVVEVSDQEIPQLRDDELLIRVALVGICATDLHLLAGHIGNPFPLVPGHEFVGEVAAMGSGVSGSRLGAGSVSIGDRVAVEMLLPCRSCARCREGRYNLCERDDMAEGLDYGRQLGVNIPRTVAPGLWGGYAEYLVVPQEAIVHRLPKDLPWETAVLVEPLAVAFRAIHRGRVGAGDRVVVIGPGPVGLLIAAAARSAGARVAIVGTRKSRLGLADRFGADLAIDSSTDDVAEKMVSEFGGLADVAIEIAGSPRAQEQAVRLVRRGGRVVLAGACGADAAVTFRADEDLLTREIDILPSFLSAGGFEPAIDLLHRGGFPFSDLVTHHFGLDEVERAYDLIANRRDGVIKAVIDPWATSE